MTHCIVIDWGDKKLLAAHLSHTSKSSDWIEALEQAVNVEFPGGIRETIPENERPELICVMPPSQLQLLSARFVLHLVLIRFLPAMETLKVMLTQNE